MSLITLLARAVCINSDVYGAYVKAAAGLNISQNVPECA